MIRKRGDDHTNIHKTRSRTASLAERCPLNRSKPENTYMYFETDHPTEIIDSNKEMIWSASEEAVPNMLIEWDGRSPRKLEERHITAFTDSNTGEILHIGELPEEGQLTSEGNIIEVDIVVKEDPSNRTELGCPVKEFEFAGPPINPYTQEQLEPEQCFTPQALGVIESSIAPNN